MTEEETVKSIHYVPFERKDKTKWKEWSQKTLAIASAKKWRRAILNDWDIAAIEANTDRTSDDETKLTQNDKAWTYLVLACKGKAFNIVARVKDNNAFKAWKALEKKYEPKKIDSYINLTEEFANFEMKTEHSDPSEFIDQLEELNERMAQIDE